MVQEIFFLKSPPLKKMQKIFPDEKLGRKISKWYLSQGRHDLPWRKNISAYRVWISEIMLQQTQVITVIPFFKRFIHKFPNMKSLLTASEEEILALWSGLGYYRRARNIFQAKEIIKNVHKGRFPKDFQAILSFCLLYTSPSPRDKRQSRMPSSA